MRKRIIITAKDIRNGVAESEKYCPIARAVTRRGFTDVHVNVATVIGEYKRKPFTFILPRKAQDFVERYDSEMYVKPFSFVLSI